MGFSQIAPRLTTKLMYAVTVASQICDMSRDTQAQALWHELYCGPLSAEHDGVYGSVVGRAEAQTLRLSMVYALLDGSAIITAEHLTAAYALWCYCDDSARIIFGDIEDSPEAQIGMKLLDHIKSEPGINLRGLYNAMHRNLDRKLLTASLAWLRDKGKAHPVTYKPENRGRPGIAWFAGLGTNERTNSASPETGICSFVRKAEVKIEEIEPGRNQLRTNEQIQHHHCQDPETGICSFVRRVENEIGQGLGIEMSNEQNELNEQNTITDTSLCAGGYDATALPPLRTNEQIQLPLTTPIEMSNEQTNKLSPYDLAHAVRCAGGKFQSQGDGVEIVGCYITPAMSQALAEHILEVKAWLPADRQIGHGEDELATHSLPPPSHKP